MIASAKRRLQADTEWWVEEAWRQAGYAICEIKGISREGCIQRGSLASVSRWGKGGCHDGSGWVVVTSAAFVKIREKDVVKNQDKMMGAGASILMASSQYRKSGSLRQGTSLLVLGTAQVRGVNWRADMQPCWREAGCCTAGGEQGRRSWQGLLKPAGGPGPPFQLRSAAESGPVRGQAEIAVWKCASASVCS